MNSWYKQHSGISDALYQVKEAIQNKTKQNSMEIWDGLHLEKQGLRDGGVKHSLETSWLNFKGSQLQNLASKKNQYAKSENSGQTRPLSAPSTLSNPTAIQWPNQAAVPNSCTWQFSATVNSTHVGPADEPRARTLPWLYTLTYPGQ